MIDHSESENEEEGESTLFCSFCGKGDMELKNIIKGETGNICDECIELCYSMIDDEK
ncbi:ClpX C4-type zinc finger protein [Spartinivicinus ruber]|uniref:ClpX C4-type zinc finger protein n=1 Tax=Spartinivicinus ruber TaxID=2683272 RepID=UPI0038B49A39